MSGFLTIALVVAMAATVASLLFGVFTMTRRGGLTARHGNRAMQFRVGFQLAAVILLGLLFLLSR